MSQPLGPPADRDVGHHQPQLQRLARAFADMHATLSLGDTLDRITRAARLLTGARSAVTTFTARADGERPVTVVSRSDDGEERSTDGPSSGPRLAMPLLGRDQTEVGRIEVAEKQAGAFTSDDRALLAQLAAIASVAVENADLYERERRTARTLQTRLMPEDLPAVEGLRVAGRHLPGGEGISVGGDWYDVIELGGDRVGLVIGDVMGRGVEAASVMGQLRIGLRAYALDGMGPGDALEALARLVHTLGGQYFVTVLYAVWDLAEDAICFASAGHPAPLLHHPDGELTYLRGEPGLPIGVDPHVPYVEHRVDAEPGATLVLFTDGLVERPQVDLGPMLDALAEQVGAAGEDVDAVADAALAVGPAHHPDDDVAVLVASRPAGAGVRDRRPMAEEELRLPPDPVAVGTARRWLVTRLHTWSVDELADTVELLASEVVTNAVVHASTDVRVRLERFARCLRISVTDGRTTLPARHDFLEETQGGRGMGLVDTLADAWGVDVEEHGKTVWFEAATAP